MTDRTSGPVEPAALSGDQEPASRDMRSRRGATMVAPAGFVLLWSTGFIGAKFGLPYVEPMTFLAVRFALAVGVLGLVAIVLHSPWPRSLRELGHLAVAGTLLHAGYLGGIFAALDAGLEAGVVALIAGIQPVAIIVLMRLVFGETFRLRQYAGVALGLLGVTLVVLDKLGNGIGTAAGLGLAAIALVGITLGTVYQKRHCGGVNLITSSLVQFAVAFFVVGLLAAGEDNRVAWSWPLILTMSYLVIVLSVGSILLFYYLLRAGTAHQVSSLFFLVPPTTALLSTMLFGETLSGRAILGMTVAVFGVALVSSAPWRSRAR